MLSVEDHISIQTLYSTYNQSIDGGRLDTWVSCFAPDGALAAGGEHVGHEALTAFFHIRADAQSALPFTHAQHWITNLLLEEHGEVVKASCYLVRFAVDRQSGDKQVVTLGRYEDEIVKHDGRWVFGRRAAFPL